MPIEHPVWVVVISVGPDIGDVFGTFPNEAEAQAWIAASTFPAGVKASARALSPPL